MPKVINQEEGIDYEETYAPVARLEAICMLLVFACHKNFKLFQMDFKSAFLNGFISKKVYDKQSPDFENSQLFDYVFKLTKALYGLKQAPHAWYDCLSKYLLILVLLEEKLTLLFFGKTLNQDILLVQICVDDITFGAINEKMCEEFATCMQSEFEMSMIGTSISFLKFKSNDIRIVFL